MDIKVVLTDIEIVRKKPRVTFEEKVIRLEEIDDPSIGELYYKLEQVLPWPIRRYNYILYWQFSATRFLPIYDTCSLQAFLMLKVNSNVYLIRQDTKPKKWREEQHPLYVHRGRDSDIDVLASNVREHERCYFKNLGYSEANSFNMRLASIMLKGVPKLKVVEVTASAKSSKKDKTKGKKGGKNDKGKGKAKGKKK